MFCKKPETLSIDKRYTELGNNYRFFLRWRHALFAGFIVIIGAILVNTINPLMDNPKIACFIPIVGSFVTLIFSNMDKRTRTLYRMAIGEGRRLEGEKGGFYSAIPDEPEKGGLYSTIPDKREKMTHSQAIDIFYLVTGGMQFFLFIGLTIYAFCYSA